MRVTIGLLCLFGFAPLASANPWDISLRGLGRPRSDSLSDPAVQRYRALTTELAFAMAPRPLQPAETLGMSGFVFALSSSLTDINQAADYWQGQPGEPVFEGVLRGRNVPSNLWTPTLQIRKGLPLSTEVGIQATYLAYSEMVMLGGEFKIAIYESYFRWVPALAARGAVGRLIGSSDIDMLTVEGDIMTSLPFGVGGMAQVTPYLGAGYLGAHVNSNVLDETPYSVTDPNDQKGGDGGSLYTFLPTLELWENKYPRYFGGLRINVAMLELLYEFNIGIVKFNDRQVISHSIKFGFDV